MNLAWMIFVLYTNIVIKYIYIYIFFFGKAVWLAGS